MDQNQESTTFVVKNLDRIIDLSTPEEWGLLAVTMKEAISKLKGGHFFTDEQYQEFFSYIVLMCNRHCKLFNKINEVSDIEVK